MQRGSYTYVAEINMYSFCCEYCAVHIFKIDAEVWKPFRCWSVTSAAPEDLNDALEDS